MKKLLLVFAALLVVGCGGKDKKVTESSANTGGPAKSTLPAAPEVKKTEEATGALREALLHLRRVHFAYDSDNLLPESKKALQLAVEGLVAHPEVQIYIDGHTDDRGTAEYNIALGERRARSVEKYMTRLGVEGDRLSVVSFGKERPMAAGTDPAAQAKNRRAEFRLMRGDIRLVVTEGVEYDDKGNVIDTKTE
jgi:peptidoglycan-associated lipoprotein